MVFPSVGDLPKGLPGSSFRWRFPPRPPLGLRWAWCRSVGFSGIVRDYPGSQTETTLKFKKCCLKCGFGPWDFPGFSGIIRDYPGSSDYPDEMWFRSGISKNIALSVHGGPEASRGGVSPSPKEGVHPSFGFPFRWRSPQRSPWVFIPLEVSPKASTGFTMGSPFA